MQRLAALLFGSVFFCISVHAQERRDLQYASVVYHHPNAAAATESGGVRIGAGSNVVEWYWRVYASASPGETSHTLSTLPAFRVGTISNVGNRRFLISGKNGTVGVLIRLRCVETPSRKVIVDEIKTYPGKDWLRAAWNSTENRLYAVDATAKQAHFATWTGAAAWLPNSFSVIPTDPSFPPLQGDLLDWRLAAMGQSLPGVAFNYPPSPRFYHLRQESGQWVHSLTALSLGLNVADRDGLSTTLVKVVSPTTDSFEIVDGAGTVVASGQISQPGVPVSVQPTPALAPGGAYLLRKTGETGGALFHPLLRYGNPIPFGNLSVGRGRLPQAVVGDPMFASSARVVLTPASSQQRFLGAQLWLGVEGIDPVIIQGNVAILQPAAIIDFVVTLEADDTTAGAAYPLPIPDDPNLADTVLLFQVIVIHPNGVDVAISDVFGTKVVPAGAAAAKSAAPPPAVREKLTELTKVWRFVRETKSRGLSKASKERVDAIRRRILERVKRRR